MQHLKKREEREKNDVIDLLHKQMAVEGELVGLYKKTTANIKSRPVKHLLRMIQFDSMKHIDICQVVIDVLKGEDVLKPEKEELIEGMRRHVELEKDSIDRAKKITKNVWIRETQGLKELIEKLKNDEKNHHKALKKLVEKRFFRLSTDDMFALFRDAQWLEERYKKFTKEINGDKKRNRKSRAIADCSSWARGTLRFYELGRLRESETENFMLVVMHIQALSISCERAKALTTKKHGILRGLNRWQLD